MNQFDIPFNTEVRPIWNKIWKSDFIKNAMEKKLKNKNAMEKKDHNDYYYHYY